MLTTKVQMWRCSECSSTEIIVEVRNSNGKYVGTVEARQQDLDGIPIPPASLWTCDYCCALPYCEVCDSDGHTTASHEAQLARDESRERDE